MILTSWRIVFMVLSHMKVSFFPILFKNSKKQESAHLSDNIQEFQFVNIINSNKNCHSLFNFLSDTFQIGNNVKFKYNWNISNYSEYIYWQLNFFK